MIIVPNPLITNWIEELSLWFKDSRVQILKGDLFDACLPKNEIRVTHGVPTASKVGDVFTFKYLNVSQNYKMLGGPPVYLRLRNECREKLRYTLSREGCVLVIIFFAHIFNIILHLLILHIL